MSRRIESQTLQKAASPSRFPVFLRHGILNQCANDGHLVIKCCAISSVANHLDIMQYDYSIWQNNWKQSSLPLFNLFLLLTVLKMFLIPYPLICRSPTSLWPSLHYCCVHGLSRYVIHFLSPSPPWPLQSDSCQSVPCFHASASVLFISSLPSLSILEEA